jgi:hypothetical protein
MIDVMARVRSRPICALLVAAGMMLSLLAMCCCVDEDLSLSPGASHPTGAVARIAAAQDIDMADDHAGNLEPACHQSAAAVGAGPVTLISTTVAAPDGAQTAAQAPPGPEYGGARAGARPRAPHLLCVMRT